MPHEAQFGYNLGLETCKMYDVFFDRKESELNALIDEISQGNAETKIISDFMNKLANAKKTDKKADFSNDDQAMDWIDHIHERNPTIFEQKRCVFKDED